MVRFLSIFIATLAAISPMAQAGACVPGLRYCGSTLIRYGWENMWLGRTVLYLCKPDGSVKAVEYCGAICNDAGVGRSDFCSTKKYQ
ncbi:hypothetical protein E4U22_001884 [Claviceps purpurea]|uniref:Uncharacterized protein n=1 Tax=Claviceps purpurea (strain 20.1) TaxID=1111077 RepID=M1W098_CLAP2|nr:hypothetical protein E4U12_007334 [Claviceps purpurea]CCE29076.1 uncharacterized protein CPUR_02767 [Claviceps purpurea 20.1]KAG6140185.1 hypothetical protein E4U28_003520 [Claviceps purpurea]KAG6165031.1 hypothetical protein E4U11_000682 [Claviceps purpurea]KAG6172862.1 hypothetical protein E4U51_006657 [Claviceps purpurea]